MYWWQQSIKWDTTFFLKDSLLFEWIHVRHLVLNREWYEGKTARAAEGRPERRGWDTNTSKDRKQLRVWSNAQKNEISYHFYIGKWYSSEIFVLNSWKRLSFFPQILQFWTTNQQDRSNGQQITCISTQNKLFLVNARKDLHPDTIESRPRCTHSMRYVLVAEWLPHRDRTSEKCIDDSRVSSETRRSSWKTPYCLNEFM